MSSKEKKIKTGSSGPHRSSYNNNKPGGGSLVTTTATIESDYGFLPVQMNGGRNHSKISDIETVKLNEEIQRLKEERKVEKMKYNELMEMYKYTQDEGGRALKHEKQANASLSEENSVLQVELKGVRDRVGELEQAMMSRDIHPTTIQLLDEISLIRIKLGSLQSSVEPLADQAKSNTEGSFQDVLHLQDHLKHLNSELASLRSVLSLSGIVRLDPPVSHKQDSNTQPEDHGEQNTNNVNEEMDESDIIHSDEPMTQHTIIQTLQTRFYTGCVYTSIGPVTVVVNPFSGLSPVRILVDPPNNQHSLIYKLAKTVIAQVNDTSSTQAVVFNGVSGSGKTYTAHLLLRKLFDVAGGGSETDAFKHLSAAVTVINLLTSSRTASNKDSSRMGYYFDVQLADSAISRTRIHCYHLDYSRVTDSIPDQSNFHIFYHMLAGLSHEDRGQLYLHGYTTSNLKYISQLPVDSYQLDKQQFERWKVSLSVLGIPFMDVMRVLSAIMLLGNVEFIEGTGIDLDVRGNNEIKAIAALLGVSGVSLYRGLTSKTGIVRGQVLRTLCSVEEANRARDCLAKALYARTLSAIIRRANSNRRTLNNSLSDSQVSETGSISSMSSQPFQSLRRSHKSSSVAIVDMFGFENCLENHLETLCANLSSETLEYFYTTNVFKNPIDSCREEGIRVDNEPYYSDNGHIVDLLSSQRSGLLSCLDKECLDSKGNIEAFLKHASSQLGKNKGLTDCTSSHQLTIRHYTEPVLYDTSRLIQCNRDVITDDTVCVFHRQNCNFGFVTHLFAAELKPYHSTGATPKGIPHRILTSTTPDAASNIMSEQKHTFSQDFHYRLDNLLKILVRARPFFVRCLKSNNRQEVNLFDRESVRKQVKSLQLLPTLHLMTEGFPHKVRFKAFNQRYSFVFGMKTDNPKCPGQSPADIQSILAEFGDMVDTKKYNSANVIWALGKRHIFLSESARQLLERIRVVHQNRAATKIQAHCRGYMTRKIHPRTTSVLHHSSGPRTGNRLNSLGGGGGLYVPPTQPTTVQKYNPQLQIDLAELKLVTDTCIVHGIDPEASPRVPASRNYTVSSGKRIAFPQIRVMRIDYPDDGSSELVLRTGSVIKVTGHSHHRGYLIGEYQNNNIVVPFHVTEIQKSTNSVSDAQLGGSTVSSLCSMEH